MRAVVVAVLASACGGAPESSTVPAPAASREPPGAPVVVTDASVVASSDAPVVASSDAPVVVSRDAPVPSVDAPTPRGDELTASDLPHCDWQCEQDRKTVGAIAPRPAPRPTDQLDRQQLAAGVGAMRSKLTRTCGHTGATTLVIDVAPDGRAASITTRSSSEPAIAACVTRVMYGARWAASRRGGRFAFVFELASVDGK